MTQREKATVLEEEKARDNSRAQILQGSGIKRVSSSEETLTQET